MPWRRLAAALAALTLYAGVAHAQAPAMPDKMPPLRGPDSPQPLQSGDAFGEAITLPQQTIIYINGSSNWDNAFDNIVDAFKSLNEYFTKQGLKAAGPAMTIYTETDDTGFRFRAAYPVAEAPANPPKGDIAVGEAPSGKALKFAHRGSYDAMDSTYEAITNYLDDKQLEAKDLFIEQYVSDPLTTDRDKLVVNVLVPIK